MTDESRIPSTIDGQIVTKNQRRVLVVTYTFPPVGGAGVQRVTKLVKYIGQFGWLPTVLTVANPSVPLHDHSLEQDISQETVVHRARSLEPSYAVKAQVDAKPSSSSGIGEKLKRQLLGFVKGLATRILQPDAQVLWYPGAMRLGRRVLKEAAIDAIIVTAPPFSSLLIGATLARASKLPLLVDYRDEWTISNSCWENKRLGPVSRVLQQKMENYVLRSAKAVVATTQASAESLRKQCQLAGSRAKVYTVYNGFDEDDFSVRRPVGAESNVFRLVYVGTLWNLTSVAPLAEAVRSLSNTHEHLAKRLEIVFVGRRIGAQADLVQSLQKLPCHTILRDYMDHSAALDLLCSADASCVFLTDLSGAERVVPAKIFECMAANRPILGVFPRGEAWALLDGYSQSHCFLPSQIDDIKNWLVKMLSREQPSRVDEGADRNYRSRFSRRQQAQEFAEILNQFDTRCIK